MNKLAYVRGFVESCRRRKMAPEPLLKQAIKVMGPEKWYKRPVSTILGRLPDLGHSIVLGTPRMFLTAKDRPEMQEIIDLYEQDPELADLVVEYGGSRPVYNLRRTLNNPRTSALTKAVGTLLWAPSELTNALRRGDHYNPFAHTAVVYHDEPSVLAHEIGHAKDFARKEMPGVYALSRLLYPVALWQEGVASRHALRKTVGKTLEDKKLTREEISRIRRMNRILGGGFGSYLAPVVGDSLVSALGGQAVGAMGQPFIPPEQREEYAQLVEKLRAAEKAEKEKEKAKKKKAKKQKKS